MRKIAWISNAPSPYKVAFMNLLGQQVSLTCLFEKEREEDRNASWYDYNHLNFTSISLNKENAKEEIQKVARECDLLINSDYSNSLCRYAVMQFHKYKKQTILHADGGLAIPRGLLDYVISFVMRKNDYFLSSGEETDRYFQYYKVPESKILHYHFACMSKEELDVCKRKREEKMELRKKLNIQESQMVLSVGQQIPRKGFDVLVAAMEKLPTVGLYIVGGEGEENVKTYIKEKQLTNIHFVPFLNKEELGEYYAASDLFAFATRYDIWGLVINEAMAYGLPIVSTDKCVAALQMNHYNDNIKIVPSEDVDALYLAIKEVLEDDTLRSRYMENVRSTIQSFTFEEMCHDFLYAIEYVLTKDEKI